MTVLILISYYLPGYKAGGPIRTISNLVSSIGNDVNFKIITSSRDYGESIEYKNIKVDDWNDAGLAKVYYCSDRSLDIKCFIKLINETRYDILYINGLFDFQFNILPILLKKIGLIKKTTTIISPRGVLSPGALKFKRWKKLIFIYFIKIFNICSDFLWLASSEAERDDIHFRIGIERKNIYMLHNLPIKSKQAFLCDNLFSVSKEVGILRVIMLSRISRVKNILGALDVISNVKGRIILDIYGPIEEEGYWDICKKKIAHMSQNISVNYKGAVGGDNVLLTIGNYDIYLSLTFGENYGHSIVEALTAGCPVLISNNTPWCGLESYNAGWSLPLDNMSGFSDILEGLITLDNLSFTKYRKGAHRYVQEKINRHLEDVKLGYLRLFKEEGKY